MEAVTDILLKINLLGIYLSKILIMEKRAKVNLYL